MKALKLDHQLAELVRSGKKTATWRMYDDKHISVNDRVELIDKVDPQDPSSWQTIGFARIDSVLEKRLGELSDSDIEGHERYDSPEEMVRAFQKFYGPQVTLDTPLKIIRFSLLNESKTTTSDAHKTTLPKEVKMYADGGSRGNPGPSASGFVIFDMNGEPLVEKGVYLGVTTNNQAEYQALKLGLEEAYRRGAQTVHVYMDSMLVVNQMLGIFKVKNRDLWPIHESIKQNVANFKHIGFQHVPRALNKAADAMVNESLDAHADIMRDNMV